MADPAPRRVAITGAPGAGKSTLLRALEDHGWLVVPEAARTILQQAGGMELRANNPAGFAKAMLEMDRAAFEAVEAGQTVIFDRGFADIAAFLRVENRKVMSEVDAACRQLRFDIVLRAPAWKDIYRQDAERIQTWDEALESDLHNLKAWRDYGYAPIDLPLTAIESRVTFLEKQLGV